MTLTLTVLKLLEIFFISVKSVIFTVEINFRYKSTCISNITSYLSHCWIWKKKMSFFPPPIGQMVFLSYLEILFTGFYEWKSYCAYLEVGVCVIKPLLHFVLWCSNLGLEEAESFNGWWGRYILSTLQVVPVDQGWETLVRHCWRQVLLPVPLLYLICT